MNGLILSAILWALEKFLTWLLDRDWTDQDIRDLSPANKIKVMSIFHKSEQVGYAGRKAGFLDVTGTATSPLKG